MADRYLRATGNWNGPVWAATSGGAAGSAATPTADDSAIIDGSFTVTLTADAVCSNISHGGGTINLSSYTMTSGAYWSRGNSSKRLDMGTGKMDLASTGGYPPFRDEGNNLTVVAGNSLLVLNVTGVADSRYFGAVNHTFNDVVINIGVNTSSSRTFSITGSPTFRSLIIQSKNSAAHTVKLDDDGAYITADKLVFIGSSPSARLKIECESGDGVFGAKGYPGYSTSTFYAQNVDLVNLDFNEYMSGDPVIYHPLYVGTSSVTTYSSGNFIHQDPPKISTLVDPLTTEPSSNPLWMVPSYSGAGLPSAVSTGYDGGGYRFDGADGIMSTDCYDIVDNDLIFEVPAYSGRSNSQWGLAIGWLDGGKVSASMGTTGIVKAAFIALGPNGLYLYDYWGGTHLTFSPASSFFVKVRFVASIGKFRAWYSTDGTTWTNQKDSIGTYEEAYMRSSRVMVNNVVYSGSETHDLGSINPNLTPATNANFLPFFMP